MTLFAPKNVYETNHTETSLCISSISFIIRFNKAGKILCFRRKSTSQDLINKMCLGVGKQNKQLLQERSWSQSDLKTQLGDQVALRYNVLITVWISLGYNLIKLLMLGTCLRCYMNGNSFLLIYLLLHLLVTYKACNSRDLFNTLPCLKFLLRLIFLRLKAVITMNINLY